jgi:ankyrin repeat protein
VAPGAAQEKPVGAEAQPILAHFDYEAARSHELKPHRRTVPLAGVESGFNQLHLTLTVSPAGDVVEAKAEGDEKWMAHWPELVGEVKGWKFRPFEAEGKAVTVEEYVGLVPPERLPKVHVEPPKVEKESKIAITLERTGCMGSCPSYKVTVTPEGVLFEGGGYVVARGEHKAAVDAAAVRELAKRFVESDFYSMDAEYRWGATDLPTYVVGVSIDGHSKQVVDYEGEQEGMPAVVSELEEAVDELAGTDRWIAGGDALVPALKAEGYALKSYGAQVMLKEAAQRGQTETVRELLEAGVPLKPYAAPKPKSAYEGVPFEHVGWLTAASGYPETLQALMDAGASEKDQKDKDLALVGAVRAGKMDAVRALLAYGADPNVNLSKLMVTEEGGGVTMSGQGQGSLLIYAAESGNPEVVKEVLRYHPDLEARGREGKTAMFAAGDYRSDDVDGARVECVRLLAGAGADVNARDEDGNTPLHETYLTDVEEELLKLGADVNARNKKGETPIFTTYDDEAIPLFVRYGADLTIRNKAGLTVLEAAEKDKGPQRVEVLKKVMGEIRK